MEKKETIRLRGIKYRNKLKEINPEKAEQTRLSNLACQLKKRIEKAKAEGREYKFRDGRSALTIEQKREKDRIRCQARRDKKKMENPKVRKNAKTPEEQKKRREEYQKLATLKRSKERAERRALQALVAPENKDTKPKATRLPRGHSTKAIAKREEMQFQTRKVDESKCTKIWIACIKANVLVPPGKTTDQVIAKWEAYNSRKREQIGRFV